MPSEDAVPLHTAHSAKSTESVPETGDPAGGLEAAQPPKPATLEEAKLKAAVHWSFSPDAFGFRRELKELVANSDDSDKWILKSSERQRILKAKLPLDKLRAARSTSAGASADPGENVLDKILKGPSIRLTDFGDTELPYLLQAVRWFAEDITGLPGIPSGAAVNSEMAHRRIRGQLRELTRSKVRGRSTELAALTSWQNNPDAGPIVVTGIGGIGKSSLVAQFLLDQPESALLLWLDFDRADLAPDNAVSVLDIMAEQLSAQVPDFAKPRITFEQWKKHAKNMGKALEKASGSRGNAGSDSGGGSGPSSQVLLVLDGFEVAQHFEKHSELWDVLGVILKLAPLLRVIISGRAPVKDLILCDKRAVPLLLQGIPREDAIHWLEEKGLEDPAIRNRVFELSRGIPLLLGLAVRLIERGGDLSDLPERLPREFVEGFLYRRILNRVQDKELIPLMWDALVLRRINHAILRHVLHDKLPKTATLEDVYRRLAREMGLIDPDGLTSLHAEIAIDGETDLQLRPEVRAATLKLLEEDMQPGDFAGAARVREIDSRAADWYAAQSSENLLRATINTAELIYHRLRLGDTAIAETVWRHECSPYLESALDDLAPAAHAWLRRRLNAAHGHIVTWEADALKRIWNQISRGLERGVPQILGERRERSGPSPIVFYDAWVKWKAGDYLGAGQILDNASLGDPNDTRELGARKISRDRRLLRAAVAVAEKDTEKAEWLLASISDRDLWGKTLAGKLQALAVLAVRIRLTIDLITEVEVLGLPKSEDSDHDPKHSVAFHERLNSPLLPSDCLLSEFGYSWDRIRQSENPLDLIPVPGRIAELTKFHSLIEEARSRESLRCRKVDHF
ncbi:MAG: hypothetical protein ACAI35_16905, partial [Candidatus Methylacidiphilales bacterium]